MWITGFPNYPVCNSLLYLQLNEKLCAFPVDSAKDVTFEGGVAGKYTVPSVPKKYGVAPFAFKHSKKQCTKRCRVHTLDCRIITKSQFATEIFIYRTRFTEHRIYTICFPHLLHDILKSSEIAGYL